MPVNKRTAEIEQRKLEIRVQEPASQDEMIVEGRAVVYDIPTLMYEYDGIKYYEIIAQGALNGADMVDVPLKYNHSDAVMTMARTRNKTLVLIPDEQGLMIRARLADTTAGRDLYALIKRGDIDKMSFGFTVVEESYDKDTRTRKILRIKRIWDVSAVDTPAYSDTSITARSWAEAEAEAERKALESAQLRKLLKAKTHLISKGDVNKMFEKRIAEIEERKVEIRALLEKNEAGLDLDKINTELDAMGAEMTELRRKQEYCHLLQTASSAERVKMGFKMIASIGNPTPWTRGELPPGQVIQPGEFRNISEFLTAVAERRPELRTFQSQDPNLGGFAVPTVWAGWLLDQALEQEIVRPRARVVPLTSDTLKIPAWQAEDRSTNVYGGFVGQWLQELQEANIQTGRIRSVDLNAHKLAIYTAASREVLQDAIQFEANLLASIRDSIAFYLDRAFLTGTGVNQPQGLLACQSAVNVNRGTAGNITYADLADMYAALWKQGGKPVWICAHEAIPELLTLADGAGRLIFQPAAAEGVPANLFGYPLISTEKLGTELGERGDILLVNLTGYAVGLRQGVLVDVSNAPGWTRDRVDFRVVLRADGRELWEEPITTDSGKRLSWLVALAPPM